MRSSYHDDTSSTVFLNDVVDLNACFKDATPFRINLSSVDDGELFQVTRNLITPFPEYTHEDPSFESDPSDSGSAIESIVLFRKLSDDRTVDPFDFTSKDMSNYMDTLSLADTIISHRVHRYPTKEQRSHERKSFHVDQLSAVPPQEKHPARSAPSGPLGTPQSVRQPRKNMKSLASRQSVDVDSLLAFRRESAEIFAQPSDRARRRCSAYHQRDEVPAWKPSSAQVSSPAATSHCNSRIDMKQREKDVAMRNRFVCKDNGRTQKDPTFLSYRSPPAATRTWPTCSSKTWTSHFAVGSPNTPKPQFTRQVPNLPLPTPSTHAASRPDLTTRRKTAPSTAIQSDIAHLVSPQTSDRSRFTQHPSTTEKTPRTNKPAASNPRKEQTYSVTYAAKQVLAAIRQRRQQHRAPQDKVTGFKETSSHRSGEHHRDSKKQIHLGVPPSHPQSTWASDVYRSDRHFSSDQGFSMSRQRHTASTTAGHRGQKIGRAQHV